MVNIALISNRKDFGKFESVLAPDYDTRLDSHITVLRDICEVLAEHSIYKLEIEISGVAIPVDIRTDLWILMEQIPDILTCIDLNKGECIIDLYEQGIESHIHFHINEDETRLLLSGKYQSTELVISNHVIENILSLLLMRFVLYSFISCPEMINSSLLKPWIEHPSVARRLFNNF